MSQFLQLLPKEILEKTVSLNSKPQIKWIFTIPAMPKLEITTNHTYMCDEKTVNADIVVTMNFFILMMSFGVDHNEPAVVVKSLEKLIESSSDEIKATIDDKSYFKLFKKEEGHRLGEISTEKSCISLPEHLIKEAAQGLLEHIQKNMSGKTLDINEIFTKVMAQDMSGIVGADGQINMNGIMDFAKDLLGKDFKF